MQIHPGQVTCHLSHLTQMDRKRLTLLVTPMGSSFPPIHLTWMSLDCVRNLDHPQETPMNIERMQKLTESQAFELLWQVSHKSQILLLESQNVEPSVHGTRLAMKQSVKFPQVPKEPHFMLNWYQNARTGYKQMAAVTCKLGSPHWFSGLQGHTILYIAQGCANSEPYVQAPMRWWQKTPLARWTLHPSLLSSSSCSFNHQWWRGLRTVIRAGRGEVWSETVGPSSLFKHLMHTSSHLNWGCRLTI